MTLALDRCRDAWHAAGLVFQDGAGGTASAQAPDHSTTDRSVTFRQIDGQVLVNSHADPKDQVLESVGLTMSDLFDEPRGVAYSYPGGSMVFRTPDKRFRQQPARGDRTLYRSDELPDDTTVPVYVVEGEKDAEVARSLAVPAVSTRQGSSTKAERWDWTPLAGRPVVVVRDRDDAGHKHALDVIAQLEGIAADTVLVEAADGKDLADHVMAGHGLDELVPVEHKPAGRRLKVTRASEVTTKRIRWVMRDWVPCGSLTLLAGREGLGKSTLACKVAADVTRGELEGEFHGTPRTVLYIHTEDSRSHTVKPRLEAAGADLDRVLFLDVQTEYSDTSTLVLPHDADALEAVIEREQVGLVVLDAATSAMSSELSGRDDRDVRRFLEPLAALAERQDCVVLGLCHFGKRDGADTGKLILGSIAWSQVARSVLSVALDEETSSLVVTNTKGNLARQTRSMRAVIASASVNTPDGPADIGVFAWSGETDTDARDLLAGVDASEESDERAELIAFVTDYLAERGGTAPAGDLLKAARAAGLNDNAVKKVRRRAGVRTERVGFGPGAAWVGTMDAPIGAAIDAIGAHSHERESMAPMPAPTAAATVHAVPDEAAPVRPAHPPEAVEAVAGSLSHTHPLDERTLAGSVPKRWREQVPEILAALVADGLATTEGGRYLSARDAA